MPAACRSPHDSPRAKLSAPPLYRVEHTLHTETVQAPRLMR
jgi:hypothetical protein